MSLDSSPKLCFVRFGEEMHPRVSCRLQDSTIELTLCTPDWWNPLVTNRPVEYRSRGRRPCT